MHCNLIHRTFTYSWTHSRPNNKGWIDLKLFLYIFYVKISFPQQEISFYWIAARNSEFLFYQNKGSFKNQQCTKYFSTSAKRKLEILNSQHPQMIFFQ